jgi:hypothetical protein
MKKILTCLLLMVVVSCEKPVLDESRFGFLWFTQVQTSPTATVSSGIRSDVKVGGPNLCYNFSFFQSLRPDASNVFVVHAHGTVPTAESICAHAIYSKDTTVRIPVGLPGRYIVKFINPDGNLFKADTVQVN